jgi:hypothetical protein
MRFATDCGLPDCHEGTRKKWHKLLVTVYFLSFVIAVFLPVIHTIDSMMWTVRASFGYLVIRLEFSLKV